MKFDYRLIALLGVSAGSCIQGIAQNSKNQRPNIIFIMSDDHAYQAISAYGGPLKDLAPTPNIDRIANDGMRFDRCLVTNSISGPCRATILTGKYSHTNGFYDNSGLKFDGSQQTFPKLLLASGYQTAIIGKWHLGSDPTGFSHWEVLPAQGAYYNPEFLNKDGKHKEDGYVTELITKKSIDWLKEANKSGKPFMLMMHHKAPHREWLPGPNELSLYKNVTFPEPSTLFDTYENRGTAEHDQDMTIETTMRLVEDLKITPLDPAKKNPILNLLTEEQLKDWNAVYDPIVKKFYASNLTGKDLVRFKYQRYLQDYLACIAGVDKSVGKVLDFLKENGLDKNTIVVYTSDQGFYLGEHGWFDKRWMFEQSYRTPMLIEWPGVIKSHSINQDMVSNIDIAETFLDAARVKIPEDMQGESLLPILKGNTPKNWRTEHYYHYYEYPQPHHVRPHYGISNEQYKLIHFYGDIDEWELFDIKADPQEMKNVYNDRAYAKVREDLHKRLDALRVKYKDSDEVTKALLEKGKKSVAK
jgi:arylsulfatase A-like enzyme